MYLGYVGIYFWELIKFVGIVFAVPGLRDIFEIVKIFSLCSRNGFVAKFNALKSISNDEVNFAWDLGVSVSLVIYVLIYIIILQPFI